MPDSNGKVIRLSFPARSDRLCWRCLQEKVIVRHGLCDDCVRATGVI